MASAPLLTGKQAVLVVEFNTAEFNQRLAQFAERFASQVPKLVLAHALDLQRRVQMRTPVDTGRLRNSIHTVPPGTRKDVFPYKDRKGRAFEGSLGVQPGPYEAVVGTNVVYAPYIEAGWSKQAPSGMFAVSFTEKLGTLEQALGQTMMDSWNKT